MSSIESALLSLDGLSVGDAFGATLGEGDTSPNAAQWMKNQELPPGPWQWTDDTHMALSIVEVLYEFETIEQDALAEYFAERFEEEPYRGYGAGAAWILSRIAEGGDWRRLTRRVLDGGSYGNGAAMRAAPIGGFFRDEPERAAQEARKSALVTHAHQDGQAGAIAVAVAAAIASNPGSPRGSEFLSEVARLVPSTDTQDGIQMASRIPAGDFNSAVEQLGTGWQVSAQDTVPFCLWCAAHHLEDFEAALWQTARGAGDRDTTCAIVGGIVALYAGEVPQNWLEQRESLPTDFII